MLASLITVITIFCAAALQAEGSRSLYAFARDRGLPFSDFWSKVHVSGKGGKRRVPLNAVFLAGAFQMALCAIDFGTVTGLQHRDRDCNRGVLYVVLFSVLIVPTEGSIRFIVCYAPGCTDSQQDDGRLQRAQWALQAWKYGLLLNIIGFVFLLFASITFNFPTSEFGYMSRS